MPVTPYKKTASSSHLSVEEFLNIALLYATPSDVKVR
jgi:hypothetical protein